MSFSRQFLLAGSALLILGMAIIGSWLGMEIERSAVNRAAAVAAIYVESILAAQLRHDPGSALAAPATHAALDQIFNEGPLRRKVVRFKLWDADGVIRYSNDHSLVGQRFSVDGALAAAFSGTVVAHISDLDEAEHAAERTQWQHLLEVYVPVRAAAGGEVIAVAEFYHSTDNLDRDIRSAQQRSWVLVGVATLAIFLLLFVQVHRANDTIVQQRDDLRHQLQQLRAAFEENERMRARLGEAGAATTTLNEQFLHRVAADLHDGPAQSLAFALMRFDEMVAAGGDCDDCDDSASQPPPDLKAIQGALRSSLDDLRNIAAGLGMPGIAALSITETARRAVRDFERQFGLKVAADIEEIPNDAALATKITVYRLLQESMSNSHRHALGSPPRVRVWRDDGLARIEVADDGAGFDPHLAARSGRLGLAFMLERVRLLGGTCEIESAPGRGTRVLAGLPLSGGEMS